MKKPKINTPYISTWRRANPFSLPKYDTVEGLDFRILNLEICHDGEIGWKGNLIFIYEAKTFSLFHHLLIVNEKHKVTWEQILYLVGKAEEEVFKKVKKKLKERSSSFKDRSEIRALLTAKKTIYNPLLFQNNHELTAAYEKAFSKFSEFSELNKVKNPAEIFWRKKILVKINFHNWEPRPCKPQSTEFIHSMKK